jgi:hypothetical protein
MGTQDIVELQLGINGHIDALDRGDYGTAFKKAPLASSKNGDPVRVPPARDVT